MTDPLTCIAFAIYFEARGEVDLGQRLVADTVLNRVESPRYPNDACEVVKQKHQFEWYWDGKPEHIDDKGAYEKSVSIATKAISSPRTIDNVCHFTAAYLHPKWAYDMTAFLVGNALFYSGGC